MNKETDYQKIIMIGDKVLLKPIKEKEKTKSGLYLPPGYSTQEPILTGYVIKVGPGYPIPRAEEEEEWKTLSKQDTTKYIPLQVKEGDLVFFLQKNAIEVFINDEKHFVVPQYSILFAYREEL